MNRFSGWTRSSAVAALLVLSTGACAQRVPLPPEQVAAAPAPRVQAPAPVVRAPAPAPRRAEAPATRPAPRAQEARRSPPPPPPSSAPGAARPQRAAPDPVAPRVASIAPPGFGGQFRVSETASDDYGSTSGDNPTPDTAPDPRALSAPDTPPAPPATRAQEPPRPPAPPPLPEEDVPETTLSALASLFGASPAPAPPPPLAPRAAPAPVAAPQAENPYPGGFDDGGAYETAQIYQQQQQPIYRQPSYYDPAPAPLPPAPRFDPDAPVTVAILTPDTDSRPSIRTLAKGLSQAAALSARTQGNRRLVLRGYDTGGTPEKARLAAQQAISDGAQLIVGPLFSTSAAAVAPVAQASGVPVIAFTTDVAVLGNGVYSIGYLPDAEVERMLSFAAQRGIRKIGLLSPDTPYGGIVFRTVQNAAPRHGVEVATVQPIGSDFSQAAATGERFANFYKSAPDTKGVLIATNGKPLQGIAAYLAYNDVLPSKVQYMGLGTWDDPETFREATLVGGWFPGLDPALKAEFEGRYSGAYGGAPPAIATLAYDGIAIAGALIGQAQSTGQPPFTRQGIENPTGFRGMSGLFRFLPDGRNQRLLSILKVGRRQFEMLDPAPATFGQRLTSTTGYSQ